MKNLAKIIPFINPDNEDAATFQEAIERRLEKNEIPFHMLAKSGLAVIYGEDYYQLIWHEKKWSADAFVQKMSSAFHIDMRSIHFQGHIAENIEFKDFVLRHFQKIS